MDFLRQVRDDLFAATPVVFFSARRSPPRLPNSTGVSAELNLAGTLALAIRAAARCPARVRRQRCRGANRMYANTAREQFREFETRLDITYLLGLPTAELEATARGLARTLHRVLPGRLSRRRRARTSSRWRISAACRASRERADLLLGRLGHGPRHRRRQPQKSGRAGRGGRRGRRSACCAASRPTASRSRQAGPERRSGRLAPAAAVEHQRSARPGRYARALPRTERLGPLPLLHHRRARAAARADRVDRRAARSAIETAARRGAAGREPGEAARELRSDLRPRRTPDPGAGGRARAYRARTARRSRPADRAGRRGPAEGGRPR